MFEKIFGFIFGYTPDDSSYEGATHEQRKPYHDPDARRVGNLNCPDGICSPSRHATTSREAASGLFGIARVKNTVPEDLKDFTSHFADDLFVFHHQYGLVSL